MIKERAYAKINLALEVMEKKDGYHMVNNIMIPISLYDDLEFTISDSIFVENDTIEDNICIKAAKLFISEFNINDGVCINLNKKIPQAAGLAGGSSDAAAVLRGLNRLFNINASADKLRDLASKLGSDVPFFIENKPALCTNRGEIITPIEYNLDKINMVLIKPDTGLSTKIVYQNYSYNGIKKEEKIANILKALKFNDYILLKNNIFNDLEAVSIKLNDELNHIYNELSAKNFDVHVSGSGPTMYILKPSKEDVIFLKEKYKHIFVEEVDL